MNDSDLRIRIRITLKGVFLAWKRPWRSERVTVVGVRVTGLSSLVCVSAQAVAAAGWISFASESASLVEDKMLYWANGGGRAARSPVAKQGKADPKEEGSRCLGRGWCVILCLKPKLELKPNSKFHLKLKLGLEPELVLMSVSSETTSEGALSVTLMVGYNLLRLVLAGRQANLWRGNGIL